MRYYKKKPSNNAYAYVPTPGSQAELIERCLSQTEWKTSKNVADCVNRKESIVRVGRVGQHLEHHYKTGRLQRRESFA